MGKRKPQIDQIDLHGLRHKPALEMVRKTLAQREENGSFSVIIVTGNSSVLQEKIFDEILAYTSYNYYIPSWNLGQIIVENMVL
ncbi:MAG: hypothetical protein ACPIA1_00895 [Flavobacteriaceae bacterium]